MTAEDYLRYKEQENKRLFGSESINIGEAYKEVKMARKEEREKLTWHDLMINPDDLPKDGKEVIVRYIGYSYIGDEECTDIASYVFDQDDQCYEFKFKALGSCQEILAWIEIPEFK
mgnify:CR=1 FL=1